MGVKCDCEVRTGKKVIGEIIKLCAWHFIYYGGFIQDNLSLTDWVNSQRLTNPLFCLGDGHDGVWNLFEEIASPTSRQEILDWYHLRENLYKIKGSLKRLKQAEAKLWHGQVDEAICASQQRFAIAYFVNSHRKQARNFCAYLAKHRHRKSQL
jgi:hypothetical protein